jgi:hypothetical protein
MAEEMDIAVNTLRSYVKTVLTKLGAHSRLQAAALAAREDLLGELSAQTGGSRPPPTGVCPVTQAGLSPGGSAGKAGVYGA